MLLAEPEKLPPELAAAMTLREVKAGEVIYHRGDPVTVICAVRRGRVQLLSCNSDGRPVALYVIRAGECISEAALFAESYCGDAIAEIPSLIAVFPKRAVVAAFLQHAALAQDFASHLTGHFDSLRSNLELRSLQTARERIVQYFAMLTGPGERLVRLDRPLKNLADDLGLTHESFYRTLSQLVREGVVERSKGSLFLNRPTLHDRDHAKISRAGVSNSCDEVNKAHASGAASNPIQGESQNA